MDLFLALVLGSAFGAVLQIVGAANPDVLVRMLTLRSLSLAKSILLGIGIGSILMFGGQLLGLVDVGHMSVKALYAGVLLGGVMLGIGWAVSGFCPGTAVVGLGAGRKDAWFFVAGGLLGAAVYMQTYPFWKASGLLDTSSGGKLTLGSVPGSGYDSLLATRGDLLGIALGAGFIAIAFLLPERLAAEVKDVPAE